jgi:membrane protease YdiL (CAAX protease family)
VSDADRCGGCAAPYKPGAQFCAACGARRAPPSELPFVIWFFVAQLATLLPGVVYILHFDGSAFTADVALSAALLVTTLAFALARRSLWTSLYATPGFGPRGYLAIVLLAPLVLAAVLAYVHGMGRAFGIHVPDELEHFQGHHVLWMVALVAVLPPVVEELAFRGVMFTGLRRTLRVSEAFVISSMAFALLHLSIPSVLTHLPLGLYLCYLRYRSGSLWPSMLAHALHNAGVIVVGALGLA